MFLANPIRCHFYDDCIHIWNRCEPHECREKNCVSETKNTLQDNNAIRSTQRKGTYLKKAHFSFFSNFNGTFWFLQLVFLRLVFFLSTIALTETATRASASASAIAAAANYCTVTVNSFYNWLGEIHFRAGVSVCVRGYIRRGWSEVRKKWAGGSVKWGEGATGLR